MPRIFFILRLLDPASIRAGSYAASLAKMTGWELHVLLPVQVMPSQDEVQRLYETAAIRIIVGTMGSAIWPDGARDRVMHAGLPETFPFGPDDIVVDPSFSRRDVTRLHPRQELSVARFGSDAPKVLVPIGNRPSTARLVREAIPFAKAIGASVVFYHTTWKDRRFGDAPAREHMTADAQEQLQRARICATEAGVMLGEEIIETADSVAGGIIGAACRERCSLILMVRGNDRRSLGFDGEVVRDATCPVLVFGEVAR